MTNPFVHVELRTKDVASAKSFYGKLFDWSFEEVPLPGGSGTYTLIRVGEGTGGGIYADSHPAAQPAWTAYVGVDDIHAATAKARELGATICVEPMEVGDYGWMSVFTDPTGAMLAMWQPKGPPPGH